VPVVAYPDPTLPPVDYSCQNAQLTSWAATHYRLIGIVWGC